MLSCAARYSSNHDHFFVFAMKGGNTGHHACLDTHILSESGRELQTHTVKCGGLTVGVQQLTRRAWQPGRGVFT